MPIYLVTGGSGSFGSQLVQRLAQKEDNQVVVFDRVRPSYDLNDKIRYIEGDITIKEQVAKAMEGVEVVFHVAALVRLLPIAFWEPFYQVNVVGTQNVVDCCLMSNTVKKLIFTSSFSTILDGKKEFAGEEDAPSTEREKHQMAYSATKAISERIVLSANKANEKLLTCAIRPAFIFGEKDKTLINEVTRITGKVGFKRLPQWKDKKTDFVHMENLIDAHLLAEEKLVEDSPVPGQAYFITNNEPVNFLEFLSKLGEGLGYPIRDVSIPFWILAFLCQIGEWWYNLHGYLFGFSLDYAPGLTEQALNFLTQNFYVTSSKAERDLGYKPKISMEEGLRRTIEAFKVSRTTGTQ